MKRVMVFGTFDILHPGHIHFLRQAKKLGDFLIVSLAREKNIRTIKGHKASHSENQRLTMVRALKIVDKAILGSKDNYIKHIISQKPDIIALGYDQKAFTKGLRENLAAAGLKKIRIVRLKAYEPGQYKTSKLVK